MTQGGPAWPGAAEAMGLIGSERRSMAHSCSGTPLLQLTPKVKAYPSSLLAGPEGP